MSRTAEQPLRVLICCDAAVARNGVGSYYGDLVEQLHGAHVHFELITPGRGPRALASMALPGDHTQRITLPSPRGVRLAFDRLAPAVVIVATPGPYGILGARLAGRRGVPLLYGFHTHFEQLSTMYWHRLMRTAALGYLKAVNRWLFRRASRVLVHSPGMVEVAEELGARRVIVAATLLPSHFDRPTIPATGALKRLLFVGRLAAEKRIDRLIDAARHRPGLQFSIAGRGPLEDKVAAAARQLPNLEALGWVERRRIPELLAAHDALVLPSDVESFGTVALEAIASARLAIVSTHCGIGQWPVLEEALHAFDPDRPDGLVEALDALAALPAHERSRRAAAGAGAVARLRADGQQWWLDLLDQVARGD
ncbi:MAG: glycosyltransferase [Pseudomonadota bacterium]|nr:MAG: glycosyltransferase [Pseudomonadota bacterium]